MGELLEELLNVKNYLWGFKYLSWRSLSGISPVVEHNEHRTSLTLKILIYRMGSWLSVECMTFMRFLPLRGRNFSFVVSLSCPCCRLVFIWKLIGLPFLSFSSFLLLNFPSPYPGVTYLDRFSFISCSRPSPNFAWVQVVKKTVIAAGCLLRLQHDSCESF